MAMKEDSSMAHEDCAGESVSLSPILIRWLFDEGIDECMEKKQLGSPALH